MKKNIVFLLFSFLIGSTYAQKELVLRGNQANENIHGAELIRVKSQSNIPAYIRFYKGREIPPQHIELFFQKVILPSRQHYLQEVGQERDQLGYTHIRYQQYIKGYPVEGSMYNAHIRSGKIYALHGDLFDRIPDASPSISERQAFEYALQFVDAETYKWELQNYSGLKELDYIYQEPEGKLVFAPLKGNFQTGDFRLAYKFDIYAHTPLSRKSIFVDAQTGDVIWDLNLLHTSDALGTAETKYSGTQEITTDEFEDGFRLREEGRGNGIWTLNLREDEQPNFNVDFVDDDNYWNNVNDNHDEVATDAHFGAEKTYDYYLEMFGRNSIDGEGFRLTSLVHFGEDVFNAFWDGTYAAFGDGNNGNALTTLDIVAHEFTHGLTDFTGNLIYQDESGALNESFSDIFGVAVERYATPQNWNWLIGEQLGGAIRSMSSPNQLSHPRNYQSTFWVTDPNFDNGGVHVNSGVQNHWFYLLVEGGIGTNDFGNAYNIEAIGFDKASAIAYRNLTVYMTPSSQYADARFYANIAASELYGACTPEVESTTNAWYAVGVGEPYEPKAISGFDANPLANCAAPFSVSFTNQSQNASDFLWDFGDGNTSTEVNPIYTYTDSGFFNVKLIASGGECGTDSFEVSEIVNISNQNACLLNALLPERNDCRGVLIDDGGRSQNYSDLTDHVVTIAPTDAYKVNIQFTLFDYEEDFDYLIVYDGPDTNSTVIGKYTGNQLPNNGNIIRSSGNSITIRQTSDPFVTGLGFELNWFCSLPLPPEASFAAINTDNCNGYVRFTDESFQPESWLWDFGDGSQSFEQNPIHFYENPGTYTVKLVTANEFGVSTQEKTDYITIGEVPTPIVADVELCEDNGTSLSASIVGEGILNWYDQSERLVQSNANSLSVLVNPGETIYYVQQEIPTSASSIGPISDEFGSGGFHNNGSTQYLIFNTFEEITIDSVWVNSNSNRSRTIQLWDSAGQLIDARTVIIPAGRQQIPLNFKVPAGTGFRIGGTQMGLYRNNSGPAYPYENENEIMTITGSSAGLAYYYYFYNWTVRGASCKSELVPITIRREEGPRPEANFDFILEGGTVTFNDLSTNAENWFWTFANNDTSTSQNPVYTFPEEGEYAVTLTVSNGAGICTDEITQTIKVAGTTDVENEIDGAILKLFPNPGNGTFDLSLEQQQPSDVKITIYNSVGAKVFESLERNIQHLHKQINLTGMSKGTYFIQIQANDKVAFRKYMLR